MKTIESHYFDCICNSSYHVLRFIFDQFDNSITAEIQLMTDKNIFKRILIALKYIFGVKANYCFWDNWELNPYDCERLIQLLNKTKTKK